MKRMHLVWLILTLVFFITVPLTVTRCVYTASQGSVGYGGAASQGAPSVSPFSSYFLYH